jgi:ferric-dicitrate binding protein FerR (iron transport regulator)
VSAKACARKWQVEASRDGRLLGKDLESALRHRETCAECDHEERELSALGRELSRLPQVSRDRVSVQRARQRLLAARNESVVDPPARGRVVSVPLAAALTVALAAAGWLLRAHRQSNESRTPTSREVVEVHAQAGARWARHQESSRIFVDFEDGAAAFEIHPHPGRSVIIRLPDGEVEDMGTVFDVRVAERHTRHVAVNEGRVSIRLNGRPTISLGAGETWDSEPAEVAPSAVALDSSSLSAPTPAGASQAVAATSSTASLSRLEKAVPQARSSALPQASAAPAQDSPKAQSIQSTKAEDDAYLHIVDLLREAKDSEAQAQAKDYLLRFPNGFRRIEVLNIATRGARDAGAHGALQ